MKYVGTYSDWRALTADDAPSSDLDDILVAMAGEADAQRLEELEAKAAARKRAR